MDHLTEEQINEYVDNLLLTEKQINENVNHLLTGAEAEAVKRHLLGCAACQEKVAEIQQVFVTLADLPEVPFQKDLATRVLAASMLAASGLRLVEPPTTTMPERQPTRVLPKWVPGLAWTIAALQIPLAGLALVYAWPMLRDWLAPIESHFRWSGWNTSGMIQSLLTWSSQVQRAIANLSTPPHLPAWNPQEGILILAVLLAAWAAGNYLLFHSNHTATH
jgi:anti-sigma factor RsiW